MPFAPHQILIASVELLMLLIGGWVLARAIAVPELRAAIFSQNRIAHWNITGFEAGLLVLTIFVCAVVGQLSAVQWVGPMLVDLSDRAGLEVVIYGLGFHGGALLAWPIFRLGRSYAHSDYGAPPPVPVATRQLGPRMLVWKSVTTILLVLPVLALTSVAWTLLLRTIGLPDAPQDLIAVFGAVKSPAVLIGLLFIACVVAPINEELWFRGAIFRYCRQRFGRAIALVVSGALFGLLHANWAGFVPLSLLGIALAIAYENSGDIRVPILAHSLFNLNTTIFLLSGLPSA